MEFNFSTVLPNQPRYTTNAYGVQTPISPPAPSEAVNVVTRPQGPEYQFLVGEGTYILRDDFAIATPQPHPSEAPALNPNPLATVATSPTCGTKVSLVTVDQRPPKVGFYAMRATAGIGLAGALGHGAQEARKETQLLRDSETQQLNQGGASQTNGGTIKGPLGHSTAPAFGEGNASLTSPLSKDSLKRRKPKNNIVKSNSSFVSRVMVHESLAKRLQEHNADGIYAFANINRAVQWLDLSSPHKSEFLTKILFTKAHALCHHVNELTKNSNHLDVVMGFSTADIIWYEPMSQKYARLNKNGAINSSPVAEICWIPGSENLFLAAHMDGSLVVYDKEKEDAPFIPEEPEIISTPATSSPDPDASTLLVSKSVNSKNQKFNPVACWKLSTQKINAFAFSPDSKHLAVVSDDGNLRIIDYLKEQLLDIYTSFYGGLVSVCWSPDGKYVVTGGQDDLVSIWSLAECRIVARCQGHRSWVNAVAFDPWRCDEKSYRFGSVGEDCRLLLWDFSEGMLHRPKAVKIPGILSSTRPRGSLSSHAGGTLAGRLRAESQATSRFRSNSNLTTSTGDESLVIRHEVEPLLQTANLPPILSKVIDVHPLHWLNFQEDCIMTSCSSGHLRTWDRPKESANESHVTL
ncbi:MAG: hypothetical protein M1825_000538 [Sarcosagium campestre]|nr:MAG: hypothetical protein M1825_000538 [Sarcosagium campestre]